MSDLARFFHFPFLSQTLRSARSCHTPPDVSVSPPSPTPSPVEEGGGGVFLNPGGAYTRGGHSV